MARGLLCPGPHPRNNSFFSLRLKLICYHLYGALPPAEWAPKILGVDICWGEEEHGKKREMGESHSQILVPLKITSRRS